MEEGAQAEGVVRPAQGSKRGTADPLGQHGAAGQWLGGHWGAMEVPSGGGTVPSALLGDPLGLERTRAAD